MRKLKLFALLATLMLSVGMWAQDIATSGTCGIYGDNLTWDMTNGVLTISGTGDMANYSQFGAPWYPWLGDITTIIVEENVTSLGNYSFWMLSSARTISLPTTLTVVGVRAFEHIAASEVEFKVIPTTVDKTAFANCHNLTAILVPCKETSYSLNELGSLKDYLSLIQTSCDHKPLSFSGYCGAEEGGMNLRWTFTDNYKLTITGSGPMADIASNTQWRVFKDQITFIDLPHGLTTIGKNAFFGLKYVTKVLMPKTLTHIKEDAFYGCSGMEELYMSAPAADLTWDDSDSHDFKAGKATKCMLSTAALYKAYKDKFSHVRITFALSMEESNSDLFMADNLEALDGETVEEMVITRPMVRNNYFNTLCLPFDMSAEQIANSSLANAEIKIFTGASIVGGVLNIEFSTVDHIQAGVPYFVRYSMADALEKLDFSNITISNVNPDVLGITYNGITMKGTFVSKEVPGQDAFDANHGVLFLGSNNQLFWPSVAGSIKPFRAYFELNSGGGSLAPRRGMPVQIVERENAPTAVESIQQEVQLNKTIENGMLIIEKNGVRYNAQGQIVK